MDNNLKLLQQLYAVSPQSFNQDQADELQLNSQINGMTIKRNPIHEERGISDIVASALYGFASGFTTLPIGDKPQNTAEAIAYNIGSLMGFVGFIPGPGVLGKAGGKAVAEVMGMEKLAKVLSGPVNIGPRASVSTYIADKMMQGASKVIAKNFEQKVQSSLFRDTIKGATHMGIAMSAQSWTEGVDGMMSGFMSGAEFGGFNRLVGNLIQPKGALSVGAKMFADDPKRMESVDKVARVLSTSMFMGLPSTMSNAPMELQIYEYLLGGYFGYHEMPWMKKEAMEFLQPVYRNPITKSRVLKPTAIDGYNELPREVQDEVKTFASLEFGALMNKDYKYSQQQVALAREMNSDLAVREANQKEMGMVTDNERKEQFKVNYAEEVLKNVKEGMSNDEAEQKAKDTVIEKHIVTEEHYNNLYNIIMNLHQIPTLKAMREMGLHNQEYTIDQQDQFDSGSLGRLEFPIRKIVDFYKDNVAADIDKTKIGDKVFELATKYTPKMGEDAKDEGLEMMIKDFETEFKVPLEDKERKQLTLMYRHVSQARQIPMLMIDGNGKLVTPSETTKRGTKRPPTIAAMHPLLEILGPETYILKNRADKQGDVSIYQMRDEKGKLYDVPLKNILDELYDGKLFSFGGKKDDDAIIVSKSILKSGEQDTIIDAFRATYPKDYEAGKAEHLEISKRTEDDYHFNAANIIKTLMRFNGAETPKEFFEMATNKDMDIITKSSDLNKRIQVLSARELKYSHEHAVAFLNRLAVLRNEGNAEAKDEHASNGFRFAIARTINENGTPRHSEGGNVPPSQFRTESEVSKDLIDKPLHLNPKPLALAMQDKAQEMTGELGGFVNELLGRSFDHGEHVSPDTGDIVWDNGNSNVNVVGGGQYNTYPHWWAGLGANKERVRVALGKIVEDNGKDKGVLVQRIKEVILEELKNGAIRPQGNMPADQEFLDMFDAHMKGNLDSYFSGKKVTPGKNIPDPYYYAIEVDPATNQRRIKKVDYKAHYDGGVFLRDDVFEAMADYFGLEDGIGSIKGVQVGFGDKSKLGGFIGKQAYHKASPQESKWMREQGLHGLHFDSTAKQRGGRKLTDITVHRDDNGNHTISNVSDDVKYSLPWDSLRFNFAEDSQGYAFKTQRLIKQLITNIFPDANSNLGRDAMSIIDKMYDSRISNSSVRDVVDSIITGKLSIEDHLNGEEVTPTGNTKQEVVSPLELAKKYLGGEHGDDVARIWQFTTDSGSPNDGRLLGLGEALSMDKNWKENVSGLDHSTLHKLGYHISEFGEGGKKEYEDSLSFQSDEADTMKVSVLNEGVVIRWNPDLNAEDFVGQKLWTKEKVKTAYKTAVSKLKERLSLPNNTRIHFNKDSKGETIGELLDLPSPSKESKTGNTGQKKTMEEFIGDMSVEDIMKVLNLRDRDTTLRKALVDDIMNIHKEDLGEEIDINSDDFRTRREDILKEHGTVKRILEYGVITSETLDTPGLKPVWDAAVRKYIVTHVMQPRMLYSAKLVAKPYHLAGDNAGDKIDPGYYYLDLGMKKKRIPIMVDGKRVIMSFEKAYKYDQEQLALNGTRDSIGKNRPTYKTQLEHIVARVPADSPSGIRVLKFGGFTNTEGYGVTVHSEEMANLGGADVDIDTFFMYFDMDPAVKNYYRSKRNQFNQNYLVRDPNAPSIPLGKPDKVMPMSFKDGTNGERMRPEFKGKSTMDLILSGHRTATSRSVDAAKGIKKGMIIEFYDDSGRRVKVRAITDEYSLDKVTQEEWSRLEGWDGARYKSHKEKGYKQFQFELIKESVPSRSIKAFTESKNKSSEEIFSENKDEHHRFSVVSGLKVNRTAWKGNQSLGVILDYMNLVRTIQSHHPEYFKATADEIDFWKREGVNFSADSADGRINFADPFTIIQRITERITADEYMPMDETKNKTTWYNTPEGKALKALDKLGIRRVAKNEKRNDYTSLMDDVKYSIEKRISALRETAKELGEKFKRDPQNKELLNALNQNRGIQRNLQQTFSTIHSMSDYTVNMMFDQLKMNSGEARHIFGNKINNSFYEAIARMGEVINNRIDPKNFIGTANGLEYINNFKKINADAKGRLYASFNKIKNDEDQITAYAKWNEILMPIRMGTKGPFRGMSFDTTMYEERTPVEQDKLHAVLDSRLNSMLEYVIDYDGKGKPITLGEELLNKYGLSHIILRRKQRDLNVAYLKNDIIDWASTETMQYYAISHFRDKKTNVFYKMPDIEQQLRTNSKESPLGSITETAMFYRTLRLTDGNMDKVETFLEGMYERYRSRYENPNRDIGGRDSDKRRMDAYDNILSSIHDKKVVTEDNFNDFIEKEAEKYRDGIKKPGLKKLFDAAYISPFNPLDGKSQYDARILTANFVDPRVIRRFYHSIDKLTKATFEPVNGTRQVTKTIRQRVKPKVEKIIKEKKIISPLRQGITEFEQMVEEKLGEKINIPTEQNDVIPKLDEFMHQIPSILKDTKDAVINPEIEKSAKTLANLMKDYPQINNHLEDLFASYMVSKLDTSPWLTTSLSAATSSDFIGFVNDLHSMRYRDTKGLELKWTDTLWTPEGISKAHRKYDMGTSEFAMKVISRGADGLPSLVDATVRLSLSTHEKLHAIASSAENIRSRWEEQIRSKYIDSDIASRIASINHKELGLGSLIYEHAIDIIQLERPSENGKVLRSNYEKTLAKLKDRYEEKLMLSKVATKDARGGGTETVTIRDMINEAINTTRGWARENWDTNVVNEKAEQQYAKDFAETFKGIPYRVGNYINIEYVLADISRRMIQGDNIPYMGERWLREVARSWAAMTYKFDIKDPQGKVYTSRSALDFEGKNAMDTMNIRASFLKGHESKNPWLMGDGSFDNAIKDIYVETYFPRILTARKEVEKQLVRELDGLYKIYERTKSAADYEIYGKALERYNVEFGSMEFGPGDAEAMRHLLDGRELTKEKVDRMGLNKTPEHLLSRSDNPALIYRKDIQAWSDYETSLSTNYWKKMTAIIGDWKIRAFERDALQGRNGNMIGKENAGPWGNFMRMYMRNVMGYPSLIPKEIYEDPKMKIQGPFKYVTDEWAKRTMMKINKAAGVETPEMLMEARVPRWTAWLSNLDAKFNLMTLMASPKAAVNNLIGSDSNTIIGVGLRHYRMAGDLAILQKMNPEWVSWDKVEKDLTAIGAIESYIKAEANLSGRFTSTNTKAFLDKVSAKLKNDPSVEDQTLLEMAKQEGLSDEFFNKTAWFLRKSERRNRRRSWLSHYVNIREAFNVNGFNNEKWNEPWLINFANRGVYATQFLYNTANRSLYSGTALGKVMARFQQYTVKSITMRKQIFEDWKDSGYGNHSSEFEKYQRLAMMDLFVMSMASVLPLSILNSAVPAPWSYFKDLSAWLFGNSEDKEKAFFGTLPYPSNILQPMLPPGSRVLTQTFATLISGDLDKFANYYVWTWLPFGRMLRDTSKSLENTNTIVDNMTGIPVMQVGRYMKKIREGQVAHTVPSGILSKLFGGNSNTFIAS